MQPSARLPCVSATLSPTAMRMAAGDLLLIHIPALVRTGLLQAEPDRNERSSHGDKAVTE